jgi:hypothetical protein
VNSVLSDADKINFSSEKRTTLMSNISWVAAGLGDRALLQDSMQRAFASARETISKTKGAPPERRILLASNAYGLRSLATLAARSAPQPMRELIPTLGDNEAEAYLLTYFAEAALHAKPQASPSSLN